MPASRTRSWPRPRPPAGTAAHGAGRRPPGGLLVTVALLAVQLARRPDPRPLVLQGDETGVVLTGPDVARRAESLAPRTPRKGDRAAVVDVLEKFADLLGVTPIIDPGVGGQVSVDVRELPISKALGLIEQAAHVDIRVSAKLLRVRAMADPNARNGSRLRDPSTPSSRRIGDILRFWLEGAGRAPGHGSRSGIRRARRAPRLRRARHGRPARGVRGRTVGVALASTDPPGGRARGRILGEAAFDGTKVLLPGCDGRLVAEVGDSLAGTSVTEPLASRRVSPWS